LTAVAVNTNVTVALAVSGSNSSVRITLSESSRSTPPLELSPLRSVSERLTNALLAWSDQADLLRFGLGWALMRS
jgi:hypothetical protein